MKLLITGGAGFIGSHLAEKCVQEGHDVTIVDDFNDFYDPAIKEANIAGLHGTARIVRGDIRDEEAISKLIAESKFDSIIHLAARAGVRPSIKSPRLYIETNILGTYNLLEAAKQAGTERFICASSSSVYGIIKETPFHEKMCLNQTISPYAATKLAAEQLCSNYTHLYGMRTINLRFFTVYGPRQRPDLAIHKFTRAISEGRSIDQYGDGSTRRDYTYVDDIIQGVMECLTFEGARCEVFNLGESQTTTLRELITLIEKKLGKQAIINQMPEQPGDVPLTYADISKAREFLGYNPTTKVAEGIPKFVDWFHTLPPR